MPRSHTGTMPISLRRVPSKARPKFSSTAAPSLLSAKSGASGRTPRTQGPLPGSCGWLPTCMLFIGGPMSASTEMERASGCHIDRLGPNVYLMTAIIPVLSLESTSSSHGSKKQPGEPEAEQRSVSHACLAPALELSPFLTIIEKSGNASQSPTSQAAKSTVHCLWRSSGPSQHQWSLQLGSSSSCPALRSLLLLHSLEGLLRMPSTLVAQPAL